MVLKALSTTSPLVPDASVDVALVALLVVSVAPLVTSKFIMQPALAGQDIGLLVTALPSTLRKIQSTLDEVLKNSATGEQLDAAVVRAGPLTDAPIALPVIGIW